jgi:hypothetical protein
MGERPWQAAPMNAADFICVGIQKAGTGWLYDQAASHPAVWMPPIKEIMYFGGRREQMYQRARAALATGLSDTGRPLQEPDREFLDRVLAANAGTIAEYRSLFEPFEKWVTGDISPIYAKLSESEVEGLTEGLPACRFLLLLREPASRLWSNANMAVRMGTRPPAILSDLRAFERFANVRGRRFHSYPSSVIERWQRIAGDRFRVFVMDDLIADPGGYRREVFAHLMLDGDKCAAPAGLNRKADDAKERMPPDIMAFLDRMFSEERRTLQSMVGGRTGRW